MAVVQPLDLWTIFVNNFAGNIEIFFFVFMIVLAYLSAKLRIPNIITLAMVGVFVIFMATYFSLLYGITVLLIGIIFIYAFSRLLNK